MADPEVLEESYKDEENEELDEKFREDFDSLKDTLEGEDEFNQIRIAT